MRHPQTSLKLHRLVEYIKSAGFDLETDEVAEKGAAGVLSDHLGLGIRLTPDELALIEEELMGLAEANEIREAQVKRRELFPEDTGVMFVRQKSAGQNERATTYPVFFSYPVDENLKTIAPAGASFFFSQNSPVKKKPTEDPLSSRGKNTRQDSTTDPGG